MNIVRGRLYGISPYCVARNQQSLEGRIDRDIFDSIERNYLVRKYELQGVSRNISK